MEFFKDPKITKKHIQVYEGHLSKDTVRARNSKPQTTPPGILPK